MFELVIRIPERPETVGRLMPGSYRIGSSAASHIQINLPEVSSRHATLTVKTDAVTIEDLGSTNGTFIGGQRIRETVTLVHGNTVHIGKAVLELRQPGRAVAAPPPPAAPAAGGSNAGSAPVAVVPEPRRNRELDENLAADVLRLSGIPLELRPAVQQFKKLVHDELLKRMNLRNIQLSGANSAEVTRQAGETLRGILSEHRQRIPAGTDVPILEAELLNEAVRLGPLNLLLGKPEITEIMVNGSQKWNTGVKPVFLSTDTF